jgi:hypothetical protein
VHDLRRNTLSNSNVHGKQTRILGGTTF